MAELIFIFNMLLAYKKQKGLQRVPPLSVLQKGLLGDLKFAETEAKIATIKTDFGLLDN
jgi:hypothetical protein